MGRLLTMKETAPRLGKTLKGLEWMVHTRQAPPSAKIGGRRMFDEDRLETWLEDQFRNASD